MLKSYLRYGAVSVKVRAMRGKLLKAEDFAKLRECNTVAEICAYLAQTDAWGKTFADNNAETDAHTAISLMRDTVASEYRRLYSFGSKPVKQVMLFAVYRAEYAAVSFALTRLCGHGGKGDTPEHYTPEPLADKSRADVNAIALSGSYGSLLTHTEHTIFQATLSALPRGEDGLPSFADADRELEHRFYSFVYEQLTKSEASTLTKPLAERLAFEVDLLNINGILRLHRRFPDSLKDYKKLMLPVRGTLTDEFAASLARVHSEAAALNLLKNTRWGKYYAVDSPKQSSSDNTEQSGEELDLETIAGKAMERFCKGILSLAAPGAYFPQIYLTLRELERDKLIRAVVAASYGIHPSEVL